MLTSLLFSIASFSVFLARAQSDHVNHVWNNTFNSSFMLSTQQAIHATLTDTEASNVNIALNFQRSNWAFGSIADDGFYRPPPVNESTPPGTLLMVESNTNSIYYTLPPNLALSRILYTTSSINGSTLPASAYVLWPWQAKSFSGSSLNVSGAPVVAWAHGTSGIFGECAPSHIRNLWYHFSAPFTLALQGYAVVAPDYAGLGVNKTAEGEDILHPYLANPAHANDVFYAVEAAQKAFPELSKQFVVMGHSQGGGAAWASAQRQAQQPVDGYLGAIAASPVTDVVANLKPFPYFLWRLAQGISSVYRSFRPEEWLQPEGVRRLELLQELQGCNTVEFQLFYLQDNVTKSDWEHSWYIEAYEWLASNGGKRVAGPMLVLQGLNDTSVYENVTTAAFNETCSLFPKSNIDYRLFEGATHDPVLNAGQQVWLSWIKDRFMGTEVKEGCQSRTHRPLRNVDTYRKDLGYFLEIALELYEVV